MYIFQFLTTSKRVFPRSSISKPQVISMLVFLIDTNSHIGVQNDYVHFCSSLSACNWEKCYWCNVCFCILYMMNLFQICFILISFSVNSCIFSIWDEFPSFFWEGKWWLLKKIFLMKNDLVLVCFSGLLFLSASCLYLII